MSEPAPAEDINPQDAENEAKAQAICDDANVKLEKWEETNDLVEDNLKWALAKFEEALQIDDLCLDGFLGKGYVLGLMEKIDEATDVLLEARQHYPEEPQIDEMLAVVVGEDDEESDEEDDGPAPANTADVSKLVAITATTLEPLPRFTEVLAEIWARFNPNSKEKVWTDAALSEFHKAVNGTPMEPSAVAFLKENFETVNKHLTQNGFVGFYVYQTATDGAETWKDLKALGYDDNLHSV